MNNKETILLTITDLVSDFTYYDRKEDEDLSADDIYDALTRGDITIDEMVAHFRSELEKKLK